jgi:uncharacterized membrane protein YcaP (DUF421 family)
MLHDLFTSDHVPEVVLRTAVIYLAVLFAVRLAGKREIGQMKPFDLVTLLILSNAVQNAMVGQDASVLGGLAAAAVILVLNFIVSRLRERSGLAETVFTGTPTLLVRDARFIPDNLGAEHLSEQDVLQAMREHGIEDLRQVKAAVLEVDGSISIIPTEGTEVRRTRRRFRRQQRQ